MINRCNISCIVDGVYIGNLFAARKANDSTPTNQIIQGITHILSVCTELPPNGSPNHLCIPIYDSSSEDLLIHLPKAIQFIQSALHQSNPPGKILVHCVMGVSRSVAVVCAYLMKTLRITRNEALLLMKRRRPQIRPNPGFLKQLQLFEDCDYEPTIEHPVYLKFKELQKSLKESEDDLFTTTNPLELEPPVKICDNIYICENVFSLEIPDSASDDPAFASITHLLLIAPTQCVDLPISTLLASPSSSPTTECNLRGGKEAASIESLELPITDIRLESLLIHLRQACAFIKNAINNGGTVLVHCLLETRTAQVICAYIMETTNMNAQTAFGVYELARPIFAPQPSFFSQLDVYEQCQYNATPTHPKVIDWITRHSPSNSRRASSVGSNSGRSWSGNSMGSIRANWGA